MKHKDWNGVFPETPQSFHLAVERALDACAPGKTERSFSMKRRFPIVLAAVVAALCVTAAAAYVLQWNGALARRFEASPAQQERLASAGAVGSVEQSVTDNGITLAAIQTLGDKNGVYLLLSVHAPEGMELTDENSFDKLRVEIQGADRLSWCGGFMSGSLETASPSGTDNARYFELWLYNTRQADWNGKTITLDFADLLADRGKLDLYTMAEGDWSLSWPLSYSDQMRDFRPGKTYTVGGHAVTVDSIQLSPLSLSLSLSGDGLEALIANSDLDECGTLCTASLTLEDGTVVDELYGPGSEGRSGASYVRTTSFERIVDALRAKSLTLTFLWESGENAITIPLD